MKSSAHWIFPINSPYRKSWLIVSAAVALLVLTSFFFSLKSGGPVFEAQSMVIASPFTNAITGQSFETQVSRAIPSVVRLKVNPVVNITYPAGIRGATNGCAIRLTAVGSSAEDAKRSANEAAQRLCGMLKEDYAINGSIVEQAHEARKRSLFRRIMRR